MILDTKMDFQEQLKDKHSKISKTIGLLRKLHKILTRLSWLAIDESFVRSHFDYGDIISDKACNAHFIKT